VLYSNLFNLFFSLTKRVLRSVFPFPVGGRGKVEGSGERWKMMFGFFGSSTVMWADQLVSPLAEVAVHVYRPVSPGPRSEQERH
jgi:hypothetical protein